MTTIVSVRKELEATRTAFHQLLDSVTDAELIQLIPGSAWTLQAEFYHITQSINYVPAAIVRAYRGGAAFSALYSLPAFLRNWVNGTFLVPRQGRKATRASIAAAYDRHHARVVEAIAGVKDDEWNRSANFGLARITVDEVAHRPINHFRDHGDAIHGNLSKIRRR